MSTILEQAIDVLKTEGKPMLGTEIAQALADYPPDSVYMTLFKNSSARRDPFVRQRTATTNTNGRWVYALREWNLSVIQIIAPPPVVQTSKDPNAQWINVSEAVAYARKVVTEYEAGRFDAPKTYMLAKALLELNDK